MAPITHNFPERPIWSAGLGGRVNKYVEKVSHVTIISACNSDQKPLGCPGPANVSIYYTTNALEEIPLSATSEVDVTKTEVRGRIIVFRVKPYVDGARNIGP